MNPDNIIIIGGVLAGGAVGSFLGCAFYRVPRGISLTKPRSHCPACKHQLTPRELIPVFSYLWQQGRARCCGIRLSPVYFFTEITCAIAGGLIAFAAFT